MNLNYSRKEAKSVILEAGLTWNNGVMSQFLDETIPVEDRNILPLAIRSTLSMDSNVTNISANVTIDYLNAAAEVLFSRHLLLQFRGNPSEKIEILDYERRQLVGVTDFRVRADAQVQVGGAITSPFQFSIINDIYYIPLRYS